jgi:serine/threonine-protein kinase
VIGTAAYMSPEQARGQPVDKRTDIWAFGCVLYEMFTGRPTFERNTVADTLAAIVERAPEWEALPAATPAGIRRLLQRCLEKDPKRRLRDVGDARLELEDPLSGVTDTPTSPSPAVVASARWLKIELAVAALIVVGMATSGAMLLRRAPQAFAPTARFSMRLGDGQQFFTPIYHQLAISPDGTTIVYSANGRLYVRRVSDFEARPIPGTDASSSVPAVSPDGQSVVFHSQADLTLKKIGLTGGVAVTVCHAEQPGRVTWGPDGIVFASLAGIERVSPDGGKPEMLVRRQDDEYDMHPEVVANGEIVLFTRIPVKDFGGSGAPEASQIVAQSIRSGERHVVLTGGVDARYLATGHLLYVVSSTLYAVRLDLARFATVGTATPVVEGVRRGLNGFQAQYAISASGTLIYLSGLKTPGMTQMGILVQADRKGLAVPLWLPTDLYPYPRYSPDGTKVAFEINYSGPRQIGIYDLSGASELRRLTFKGANAYPIWSPDGLRITYESNQGADLGLFWQRANGTDAPERLTTAEQGMGHLPDSWSPDGKTLLFEVGQQEDLRKQFRPQQRGTFSLQTLSLPSLRVQRFGSVESQTSINAVFSPNGRWVAYEVDDGGGSKVYVEPFPPTGERYSVTNEPGWSPMWSAGGKELLYSSGPDNFRTVTFSTEPTVAFGTAPLVPKGRIFEPPGSGMDRRIYDLSPDGKRILGQIMAPTIEQALAPTIEVVLNWQEELKRLVPTR